VPSVAFGEVCYVVDAEEADPHGVRTPTEVSHNHAPRHLHQVMSPVRAAVGCVFSKVIQQDSRYLPAYGSASTAAKPLS
jgi:hypothetical protein